jgi:hypothetical protein
LAIEIAVVLDDQQAHVRVLVTASHPNASSTTIVHEPTGRRIEDEAADPTVLLDHDDPVDEAVVAATQTRLDDVAVETSDDFGEADGGAVAKSAIDRRRRETVADATAVVGPGEGRRRDQDEQKQRGASKQHGAILAAPR